MELAVAVVVLMVVGAFAVAVAIAILLTQGVRALVRTTLELAALAGVLVVISLALQFASGAAPY